MSRQYYECHVTLTAGDKSTMRLAKKTIEGLKWKFSAIDGDIVLGDGVKFYATRHYNSRLKPEAVIKMLHETADTLEGEGFKVERRKVELVIYDDRSSKVKPCDGGCYGCHLDDLKKLEV